MASNESLDGADGAEQNSVVDEVLGALAGVLLASAVAYVGYVARLSRELHVAALACRDRLEKIEYVRARLPQTVHEAAERQGWRDALATIAAGDWRLKMLADELYRLGSNADRYLDAIAPVWNRRTRRRHLAAQRAVCRVLLSQDLEEVPRVIRELDGAVERASWMRENRLEDAGRTNAG